MKFSGDNAQHIGSRSEQQDSFAFSDSTDEPFTAHAGIAAVLADGMGGLAHGKAASQAAVAAFLDAYGQKSPGEDVPAALLRAARIANQAVVGLATNLGATGELGTTLAVAVMQGTSLHWISVGDSRVYLYRDQQLIRLTIDHIYGNELAEQVARGETTQAQAQNHPERASLTSYLGLASLPKVDRSVRAFPLQLGDCALVCSDGLYRSLTEEQIAEVLHTNASQMCEALIRKALDARLPAQDNTTVLALRSQQATVATFSFKLRPALTKTLSALTASVLAAAVAFLWYKTRLNYPPIALGSPSLVTIQRTGTGSPGPAFVPPPQPLSATALVARKPLPTIRFAANPVTVAGNGTARITWTTTDATHISIVPSLTRTGLKSSGTLTIRPKATTTYILKAEGPGGSTSASVVVTVPAENSATASATLPTPASPEVARPKSPEPEPQAPAPLVIQSFQAVPDNVDFKLLWSIAGADSDTCKISIADASGVSLGSDLPRLQKEGLAVSPAAETRYILTAVCGVKTLSQTLTVTPSPRPPAQDLL